MRVLLVGIGYVGSHLAPLLLAQGHEVYGLRRSERALPAGVNPLRGDVTSGAGLSALPSGIELVVFAVAPEKREEAAYRETYFNGVVNVTAALPNTRLLFVSSTSVYGPSESLVTEDAAANADTPTAKWLRRAEEIALKAHPASVVLRASGIYGPGRTRSIAQWLDSPPQGDERLGLTHRIHRDDLARCLAFFTENSDASGLYIATDPTPASVGEIYDWLMSVEIPESLRAPSAKPPRLREEKSRRMSSKKLLDLGFRFEYPSFREGYSAIFRETEEELL